MHFYRWIIPLAILGSLAGMTNPSLAESKQLNITINSDGESNFQQLLKQGEMIAENALSQTFAENSSITNVSVNILGERNGQQVPIMFTSVSRSSWQQKPQLQGWTKYFADAATLLGLTGHRGISTIKPVPTNISNSRQSPTSQLERDVYK